MLIDNEWERIKKLLHQNPETRLRSLILEVNKVLSVFEVLRNSKNKLRYHRFELHIAKIDIDYIDF